MSDENPLEGLEKPVHVLDAAIEAVLQRQESYGGPFVMFTTIAKLWKPYLELIDVSALKPSHVADMLEIMKIARSIVNKKHGDSYVDRAGYAACAGALAHAECVIDEETPEAGEAEKHVQSVKESIKKMMDSATEKSCMGKVLPPETSVQSSPLAGYWKPGERQCTPDVFAAFKKKHTEDEAFYKGRQWPGPDDVKAPQKTLYCHDEGEQNMGLCEGQVHEPTLQSLTLKGIDEAIKKVQAIVDENERMAGIRHRRREIEEKKRRDAISGIEIPDDSDK